MVKLFLLITFMFSTYSFAQDQKMTLEPVKKTSLEFKISPITGLINFTMALWGDSQTSANLRKILSPSDQTKLRPIANELYQWILKNDFYIKNENRIDSRPAGIHLKDYILSSSIDCTDFYCLKKQIDYFLPPHKSTEAIALLKKIEEDYKRLIWNPNEELLKQNKIELEKLSLKYIDKNLLNQIVIFYNSSWDLNEQFTVALYPIPYISNGENFSHSHSQGKFEFHGMITSKNKNNLNEDLSIIVHELCHSIYEEQNIQNQKELESFYTNANKPNQLLSYHWLNESLATAIGNAYFINKITGKLPKDEWYNNKIISKFSKGLYPMVEEYLKKTKSLDKPFALESIKIFEGQFPEASKNINYHLNSVSVLYENNMNLDKNLIRKFFHSDFKIESLSLQSPLNHPQTLKTLKESQDTLIIVWNSISEISNMVQYHQTILDQEDEIKTQPNGSTKIFKDPNGRWILMIRANSLTDLNKAFEFYKKIPRSE